MPTRRSRHIVGHRAFAPSRLCLRRSSCHCSRRKSPSSPAPRAASAWPSSNASRARARTSSAVDLDFDTQAREVAALTAQGLTVSAGQCDVTNRALGRSRGRDRRVHLRPDRHPREQRRHRRSRRAARGVVRRRLATRHGDRRDQRVSVQPRGDCWHEGAQVRPDHQHRLDRRQGGQPQHDSLLHRQGRRSSASPRRWPRRSRSWAST